MIMLLLAAFSLLCFIIRIKLPMEPWCSDDTGRHYRRASWLCCCLSSAVCSQSFNLWDSPYIYWCCVGGSLLTGWSSLLSNHGNLFSFFCCFSSKKHCFVTRSICIETIWILQFSPAHAVKGDLRFDIQCSYPLLTSTIYRFALQQRGGNIKFFWSLKKEWFRLYIFIVSQGPVTVILLCSVCSRSFKRSLCIWRFTSVWNYRKIQKTDQSFLPTTVPI